VLIAEDLLLLLYDDETGKPVSWSVPLDHGLAGAVLMELSLLGKVDVADQGEHVKPGRLVIRDPSPTGDPVLDARLAIVADKVGSKPAHVIGKVSKNLRGALLEQLAGRGILRVDKDKILGLFPNTRWTAADARHEAQVRAALDSALRVGTQPDQRTAALIALVHAVDAVPKVVTNAADKKALKRRAKEIAESAWAAEAVRNAVQAMQSATTTAIAASTAAVISSGG
jgi:Golgi phosphoprotein 3 GPP34